MHQADRKGLALQLADTTGDSFKLSLPFLPPLHRGDHQLPTLLLSHNQIGSIDIIHLLAGTLQAVFEPQHGFLQIPFGHSVQLVNRFAFCFQDDLGVSIDVSYLFHFYLQGKVIFAKGFHNVIVIIISVFAGFTHLWSFLRGQQEVVAAGQGDAEVVVLGEAVTFQHVGPGKAEGGHDRGAAVFHLHAQRMARLNGLVQVVEADRGEERAKELFGVRMALLHDERDPGSRLFQHLLHGLVAQEVGQPHVLVLDAVAQLQVGGDGLAIAPLVGEVGLPEEEKPTRGAQAAVGGEEEQE